MTALPPGSTIGILGGGQLGRMLAIAAARIGLRSHVYSDATGPAFDVAAQTTIGSFDDLALIEAFATRVDVITYEFENVPVAAAEAAARIKPVRPGGAALAVAQDRLDEKRFIDRLGIGVASFAAVSNVDELVAALETLGAPAILKTRRLGYDGKGQVLIAAPAAAPLAFEEIGAVSAILEGQVEFKYEVSVLVVRALSGEMRFYDVPRNTHEGGVLRKSIVPSGLPAEHTALAQCIAGRIATALEYVGVLAVEMFYLGEASLTPFVVNEIAPRVHNSGHWTIDACAVSQFENHIRAITGWPLGSTDRHCATAVMQNLIGEDALAWESLAADPRASLHLYGKNDARAGRKMGHVTWLDGDGGS